MGREKMECGSGVPAKTLTGTGEQIGGKEGTTLLGMGETRAAEEVRVNRLLAKSDAVATYPRETMAGTEGVQTGQRIVCIRAQEGKTEESEKAGTGERTGEMNGGRGTMGIITAAKKGGARIKRGTLRRHDHPARLLEGEAPKPRSCEGGHQRKAGRSARMQTE